LNANLPGFEKAKLRNFGMTLGKNISINQEQETLGK
jgi:hypothetical protein